MSTQHVLRAGAVEWHVHTRQPRRKKLVVLAVAGVIALAVTGLAVAAWVIYQGSGSGGAKGGTSQTVSFNITPAATSDTCSPGTSCELGLQISSAPVALTASTLVANGAPSVVGDAGCDLASHLTVNGAAAVGLTFGPGTPSTLIVPAGISIDGSTPPCAAGADWLVPVTLTASP